MNNYIEGKQKTEAKNIAKSQIAQPLICRFIFRGDYQTKIDG